MSSSNTAKPQPATQSSGYSVSRAQGKCHVSGRDILPGEKLMAALRETPEGFERLDVSMDHWNAFDRAGLLAFWQTTLREPEQKKKLFVDDEVLCDLFERLADTTEPSKLNFRFVLGLILMRKRMLVYEDSRMEQDSEFWAVRFRGKDKRMDLLNPRLNEEQVADVSRQLGEILNEEL